MKKIVVTGILIAGLIIGTLLLKKPSIHQSETISTPAPELGPRAHRLLPNLDNALVVVPDRPHDPLEVFSEDKAQTIQRVRSFTVSTNSSGYRDSEINEQSVHIVCVGDSVTFGWGVKEEESYPQRLELNWGQCLEHCVPALKPEHVEAYIKSILENVQPKIVLVAMRPNWMTPSPLQGYVQTMKRIHRSLEKMESKWDWSYHHSPVLTQKEEAIMPEKWHFYAKNYLTIPLLDTTPIFDANLPSGGVAFNLNNGMQQMVDRTTGNILAEGPQPSPPRSLAPEIIAKFESDSNVKEPLFYDGGHPDAEGFVLFGSALASWLTELGWME